MQRTDGGWSQLPETESHAYATGQALYALHTPAGMVTGCATYVPINVASSFETNPYGILSDRRALSDRLAAPFRPPSEYMNAILVIDDDTPMREIMAAALRSAGYVVDEARNGAEGIEKARANRYGLFVVDIVMPKLNGIEVVMTLRHDNINTPVLIITGLQADSELYVAAAQCIGISSILTKPFKLGQLLALTAQVFEASTA